MSPPRARQAQIAARRTQAVEMRSRGHTWETIAAELGYASKGAACTDVKRALDANLAELAETIEQHRVLALARLDELIREAHAVLARTHVHVSGGKVVEHQGAPLRDDGPVLAAIETLRRLEERRARLLGLDAPTRVDATVTAPVTYIDGVRLDRQEAANE